MLNYPRKDHTGEVHLNRQITGLAGVIYYNNKPYWNWSWRCLDCGAEGKTHNYTKLKNNYHNCSCNKKSGPRFKTDVKLIKQPKPIRDYTKICSEQCKTCKSYRKGLCNYYLDTGKRRTQVNLLTEPCPHKVERQGAVVLLTKEC